MSVAAAGVAGPRTGRTTIDAQALRRIVAAVTAEQAGVPVRAVRAQLADAHAGLAVNVTSPLSLNARAGETILEIAALIAAAISSELSALSGRSVARVDVRLSGLQQRPERRVR